MYVIGVSADAAEEEAVVERSVRAAENRGVRVTACIPGSSRLNQTPSAELRNNHRFLHSCCHPPPPPKRLKDTEGLTVNRCFSQQVTENKTRDVHGIGGNLGVYDFAPIRLAQPNLESN